MNVKIWRPHTFSFRNHVRSLQNGGKRSFSTSNTVRKEKAAEVVAGIPYKDLTVGVPKEMWPKEKRYLTFLYILYFCHLELTGVK